MMFNITESSFIGAEIPYAIVDRKWELAITHDSYLDERSQAACNYAKNASANHFSLSYATLEKKLKIDTVEIKSTQLQNRLINCQSLLIEATSLHCPEILHILRSAVKNKIKQISFLYLEPMNYRRSIEGSLTACRNFDLSINSRFQSIHGFMTNIADLEPGQAFFFLGFEKARLGQAFEQEEPLQQWESQAIIGVPAFESAWENDTISNNIGYLSSKKFDIQYCAASSVEAAYNLLSDLANDDKVQKSIIVAPLGTKPHTIAASLFATEYSEHDRATLIYDHPVHQRDRTSFIRCWHIYDVNVNYNF